MIFHYLYKAQADRRVVLFLLHGGAASWKPGRLLRSTPPARLPLPNLRCAGPLSTSLTSEGAAPRGGIALDSITERDECGYPIRRVEEGALPSCPEGSGSTVRKEERFVHASALVGPLRTSRVDTAPPFTARGR